MQNKKLFLACRSRQYTVCTKEFQQSKPRQDFGNSSLGIRNSINLWYLAASVGLSHLFKGVFEVNGRVGN